MDVHSVLSVTAGGLKNNQKFPQAGTGGQSNTAGQAFSPVSVWVASWGLHFLLPQSRLEKISPRLAGNHPYHTRKRQQHGEFNDRSNCCGSPMLCCGGMMNDNRNAPRCEEIVAAWLLFKPICYGCNFPLGLFSWREKTWFQREKGRKVFFFFFF